MALSAEILQLRYDSAGKGGTQVVVVAFIALGRGKQKEIIFDSVI